MGEDHHGKVPAEATFPRCVGVGGGATTDFREGTSIHPMNGSHRLLPPHPMANLARFHTILGIGGHVGGGLGAIVAGQAGGTGGLLPGFRDVATLALGGTVRPGGEQGITEVFDARGGGDFGGSGEELAVVNLVDNHRKLNGEAGGEGGVCAAPIVFGPGHMA